MENQKRSLYMNEGMTQQEFTEWATERNIKTVAAKGKFKAGDLVVYTNEFGVSFEGKEILGFEVGSENVYLNKDAYWFPVPMDSLSFEVPTKEKETITVGNITLEMIGYDDWHRKLYKGSNNRTYVDVDGTPHSMTDFGEPLAPLH